MTPQVGVHDLLGSPTSANPNGNGAVDALPAPSDQQDQQFHGEFFQAQQACTPLQPITRLIESEIPEMEFLGRKSSGYFLTCVAGNDAP